MTREERDTRIEDAIRKLATEGRPQWPFWNKPQKRVKRAGGGGDGDAHPVIPNYPEGEHIGDVEYLVLKVRITFEWNIFCANTLSVGIMAS